MTLPSRRRAARASFIGSGASILISVAQALILMPLCVAKLGSIVYGAWIGATELLIWIQLLDLGIPILMAQRIGAAIGKGDRSEGGHWFATGMTILLCIAGGLLLIGLSVAPFVTSWAQVPAGEASRFTACFRLGVAASVALLVSNGFVSLSSGLQRTVLINAALASGAATGFVVSVVLLLTGWGVWALAAGLAARALVAIGGGLAFLNVLAREGQGLSLRPTRAIANEIATLAPPIAAANVGFLVTNNTEIVLVTTILGPVGALVYALTRRVADGLRAVLDSAAWAVYGGFAHLVASDDRHRARDVLEELLSLRFAAACVCAAMYVAVNQGFVTLLFGVEHFGGLALTVAFAVQTIVSGQTLLLNNLYRAAGRLREGSMLLAGEAVGRVTAVSAALRFFGMAVAPLAAAIVSGIFGLLTVRRLLQDLPASARVSRSPESRRRLAGVAVVAVGISVSLLQPEASWTVVGLTALAIGAAGGALLLWLQPDDFRQRILSGWIRS
ncbi:MAG TPA: hypothetical protein VES67_12880 [Vicinamibacterales bacterium]|nr:hypothetical protein [Vicinamibacterales bacterium]